MGAPQSISLPWENGEASSHDLVLRHPWAGELEVCEHFGKGRRDAGRCVSPAFLSILPALARLWCKREGGEHQPISQGMNKPFHSLKAGFSYKAPAGQRQNHKFTTRSWVLRHPTCPFKILKCLAEGQECAVWKL